MTKLTIATPVEDFARPFIERGIIPSNTRRFIIDAEVGGAVRLLYETFAEPSIIEAVLEADLTIKEVES